MAGSYEFDAQDAGRATHNLVINGPGVASSTKDLAPGQSDSLMVTLQRGTYEIYCGVDDHKELGMDLHITVS
jgi:uncharacterized cupredoxin-like copper-binding protein